MIIFIPSVNDIVWNIHFGDQSFLIGEFVKFTFNYMK